MTDLLARLRELEAAATKGPWNIGHPMERNYIYGDGAHLGCIAGRGDFEIHDDGSLNEAEANAALIVAMRNALPELMARIEAMAGEIEGLREALAMSTAEMERARPVLIGGGEHRLAASLGKQCDFNRTALTAPSTKDTPENG